MKFLLGLLSFLTVGTLVMLVISFGAWVFGSVSFGEMVVSVLIWGVAFLVVAGLGNWLWRSMGSPDA
jgi:hypothetical protein